MDTQNQKPRKSFKKALVIIIVLIVLLVAVWLLRSKLPVLNAPDELPSGEFSEDAGTLGDAADDQTSAINEDLGGVDLGDLEQEFKDIDQDLNNL